MKKKLGCVMLIDDDPDDNFFHVRTIKKLGIAEKIVTTENGEEALAYLRNQGETPELISLPELIFLDINMPRMNGWEFIAAYEQLPLEQQGGLILIMLTNSENPEDLRRAAEQNCVADFISKPLTEDHLQKIMREHFPSLL
jgi:CheY-like chemotaxis protein